MLSATLSIYISSPTFILLSFESQEKTWKVEKMDQELEKEILTKYVLHWNYRGFSELPDELKTCGDHILEIYLKWNSLSCLPTWVGILERLTNLYLQHNRLSSLPNAIGELKSLAVLDVSNNFLNAIPSELGHLKNLTELLAANNCIRNLPTEIQKLQHLEKLDLSSNRLHRLSLSVCDCQALKQLYLDNNQITSLPDKIVYLPSLVELSICQNQLLYLPQLPFTSSPCLLFNDNPHLNYISFLLGCQLTAKSNLNMCNGLWNLEVQGCFYNFDDLENIDNQIIVERECETLRKDLYLVIPKSLQLISPAICHWSFVPTLHELTMRVVYKFCFLHYIEENIENESTVFKMRRLLIDKKPLSKLPTQLKYQLINGPVTLCYLQQCQKPIFKFGTVWVIPQCNVNENRYGNTSILSTVAFCSINCSVMFKKWENAEGSVVSTQWERKLKWRVKKGCL